MHRRLDEGPNPYTALRTDPPVNWPSEVACLVMLLTVLLCASWAVGHVIISVYEVKKRWLDDNHRLRQAEVDQAEAQRRPWTQEYQRIAWTQAVHRMCDREMLKLVLAQPLSAQQDNEVCTVCLDSLKPEAHIHTLPCQHQFHYECATEWFRRSFTCPRCTQEMMWVTVLRKDVQAVDLVNLDDV